MNHKYFILETLSKRIKNTKNLKWPINMSKEDRLNLLNNLIEEYEGLEKYIICKKLKSIKEQLV